MSVLHTTYRRDHGKERVLTRGGVAVQQEIGHVSPEIFNAFPRRYGPDALTAYEVS